MGENGVTPHISIALVHLRLIDYTLFGYQFMIKLSQGEVKEDDALLLSIKQLRQRISDFTVPIEGEVPFLVTEDELVVILSALTAFIDSIFILLPQSKERDEVVTVYESLRAYLVKTVFSEPSISNNGELQDREE